jgi:hypothetical protein
MVEGTSARFDADAVRLVRKQHPEWFRTASGPGFPAGDITDGARLWNYPDGEPVTVSFSLSDIGKAYFSGWFYAIDDDGTKGLINGERLSLIHPHTRQKPPAVPADERAAELRAAARAGASLRVWVEPGAFGWRDGGVAVVWDPRVDGDPTPWLDGTHYRRHRSAVVTVTRHLRDHDDAGTDEPGTDGQDAAGVRRWVTVGETVRVLIGESPTAHHLQVQRQVHDVMIGDGEVFVLDENCEPGRHGLSFDAIGALVDVHDPKIVTVPALPARLVQITRDGKPVSPLLENDPQGLAITAWMMRHTNHSMDYGFTHDGYGLTTVDLPPAVRQVPPAS